MRTCTHRYEHVKRQRFCARCGWGARARAGAALLRDQAQRQVPHLQPLPGPAALRCRASRVSPARCVRTCAASSAPTSHAHLRTAQAHARAGPAGRSGTTTSSSSTAASSAYRSRPLPPRAPSGVTVALSPPRVGTGLGPFSRVPTPARDSRDSRRDSAVIRTNAGLAQPAEFRPRSPLCKRTLAAALLDLSTLGLSF